MSEKSGRNIDTGNEAPPGVMLHKKDTRNYSAERARRTKEWMNKLDLAWCAGFLDGEGCFHIGVSGPLSRRRHKPFVECDQTVTREPLDKLRATLGGAVHQRARPTVTGKTVWHWQMSGALMIRKAIDRVLPFLVVKKRDAEILREFCDHIPSKGKRPTSPQLVGQRLLWAQLKALRTKGIPRHGS